MTERDEYETTDFLTAFTTVGYVGEIGILLMKVQRFDMREITIFIVLDLGYLISSLGVHDYTSENI